MSTSIAHLDTERRYWNSVIQPLAEKNGLLWDVQLDIPNNTVTLKLVHGNDTKSIQKHPELVSVIDVDRKKRSEERIMNEINKAIALRTHGK